MKKIYFLNIQKEHIKAIKPGRHLLCFVFMVATLFFSTVLCAQNAIVTENAIAGTPASQWDISGIGDPSIQGFATDISYNKGDRVRFKINTDATNYSIAIYRLGYYQGNGARRLGTGIISATLPQVQPQYLFDAATGLVDCGNWGESAYWDIPSSTVSGVFIAKLVRSDNSGASHIVFIVRDDAGTSDLLFKTSDATWQAYNSYAGGSLYPKLEPVIPGPDASHAFKVSYNRPFNTRELFGGANWLFNAEYPMIRWLEKNGYNLSYTTDIDTDRRGSLITRHKAFLSVGHDEYWSAGEVNNVTAARNAGVHLAFFSGNEVYWKTRYEGSIDALNTANRTLVCYKEGTEGEWVCGTKCDPLPNVWTGLWRGGCEYPQTDGCRPENALTGQLSWIDETGSMQVPFDYKNLRFWRNTSLASLLAGQVATFPNGTLGHEFDYEQPSNTYPPGRITMSSTTLSNRTHKLSLYRHSSGAWVFGAGTIQWSWGLDEVHDRGSALPDIRMQQSTVNLFADMGVQPATLQGNLIIATASLDNIAPISVISSNLHNSTGIIGVPVAITGTATDIGGVVAGVEISIDGGTTWESANGTTNWNYVLTPTNPGIVTIKCRAFDDNGNMEAAGISVGVDLIALNILQSPTAYSIFKPNDLPQYALGNDRQAIEFGFRFSSNQNGTVLGIRYYKGLGTTGTHLAHIWNNSGALLAETIFANESPSGWQEVRFANPVGVTAGTEYIASVHSSSGDYAATYPFYTQPVINGPLTAPASSPGRLNGIFVYSPTRAFPTNNTNGSTNYWVDVAFSLGAPTDDLAPTITSTLPANNANSISIAESVAITFSEALDPLTVNANTIELRDPLNSLIPSTLVYNAMTKVAKLTPNASLAYSVKYTVTVKGGATTPAIKDVAGNALNMTSVFSFTTTGQPDIVPPTVTATSPANNANSISINGSVSMTFSEALDPTSVISNSIELRNPSGSLISSNLVYNTNTKIVTLTPAIGLSYSTRYTVTINGGAIAPVVKDASGNPLASDYVFSFTTAAQADVVLPTVTSTSPANNATGISVGASLAVTFSEPLDLATITTSTIELRNQSNSIIASTIAYNAATRVATLTPTTALAYSTRYTVTVNGGTTAPVIKDVAGNALGADYVFSLTTGAQPDIIFPTILANNPINNAIDVSVNAFVSVTFSEDLNAATVTTSAIELRNASNILIASTISYNSTTRVATLIPTASLTFSTKYTVIVKGGTSSSAIKDLAGNSLASDYIFSFTTNVQSIPVLGTQPASQSVCPGTVVSFTSSATGSPVPTVRWQQNLSGSSTWSDINGAVGGTLTFAAQAIDNQKRYRAIWSNTAGSVTSSIATLTVYSQITASVSNKTNARCGTNNGSISVTQSNGLAPYSYRLNNGSYQTSATFNNLAAATYSTTVRDARGCTVTLTGIVISSSAAPILTIVSKTNTACGNSNGSIAINASGGASPYQYSINDGNYRTSSTFTSLSAGSYSVKVRDAIGCVTTLNGIVISEIQTIKTTLSSKRNANCNDDNGYLYVVASNGDGPYDYSLNKGPFRSSGLFLNLTSGTYSVVVRDDKNCLDTLSGIVISSIGCSNSIVTSSSQIMEAVTKKIVSKVFNVDVFPNPSSKDFSLSIQGEAKEPVEVRITDIIGRPIHQFKYSSNQNEHFGSDLSKGIYIVEIVQGQYRKSIKIIKE